MPDQNIQEDSEACHHCHITNPIPLNQLVKTHPLRSQQNERSLRDTKDLQPIKSFLHRIRDCSPSASDQTPSTSSSVVSHDSNEVLVRVEDGVTIAQEKLTSWNPLYDDKRSSSILTLRDIATQTSGRNTISRSYFPKYLRRKDDSSLFLLKASNPVNKRCSSKYLCSLPSGLIVAGYLLLIIVGVLVSVALTQRTQRFQSQPLPQRPDGFSGGFQAPSNSAPRRVQLAPRPAPAPQDFDFFDNSQSLARAPQPRQQARPQPRAQASGSSIFPPFEAAAPAPAPAPAPQPRPAPRPAQRPIANAAPAPFPARAPAPLPARAVPRPIQSAPAPRSESSAADNARRRQGPSNNFQHQFSLQDEEPVKGRKEPEVKIIKSWANTNSDGSYTWGYINTDGSFKNETRGADCVVRGVYGYIEPLTGDTLSYPYVSGNPCDPNEPDYYYDYDEGTINSGGAVVQSRSQPKPAPSRPRILQ